MGWLRDNVVDLLWPTVGGPSREDSVREEAACVHRRDALMLSLRSLATVDEVRAAREGIERVVADEQTRLAGVEERLRGLVSLAAVAAAVTVGIGIAQLRGELGGHLAGSLLALASVYAVVQLLAALLAAIKGLERRSFRAFQPEDLIPGGKEEEKARELRLAGITFDRMIDLQEAGNRKVEQMSVAYKALKNFVIGLLFAAAVVLVAQIATERARPEAGSAAVQ